MKLEVGKKYRVRSNPDITWVEIVYADYSIEQYSCCGVAHYADGTKIIEPYMQSGRYWEEKEDSPKDLIAEYSPEPNDKISQLMSCVDNLAKQIEEIKASLSKL